MTHKVPPKRPLGRSLQDPDVGQDPTDDVRPLDLSLGADVEVSPLTNVSRRRLIAPRKKDPNHRSIHQKLQVLQHNRIPMILNGTHGAIGVSKIRDLLNLNLGNSRTNPLGMIPPDPKDIDRITGLINLKDLPKDRNREEETTKEEEKAEHSPRAKAYLQKEMQGQYILLQLMLIHLAVEALPSPVVMNSTKNKSQMTHFGVQQSTQLCRMKAGSQFWQNCLQQI